MLLTCVLERRWYALHLTAEGRTEVGRLHHIDRGYDDFVGKLQRLGADIVRVDE